MRVRNSKRVLSWLLTLVMVVGMLPTAALAAEEPEQNYGGEARPDTDRNPTEAELEALGYSIVPGYNVTIGTGSLWLNGAEVSASTTISMLKLKVGSELHAAFFYESTASINKPDYPDNIASLRPPTGGNPTALELKVNDLNTPNTLHVATPQDLSELHVDAQGRIYYKFTPHIHENKEPIDFYLGANGFTTKTDDLPAIDVAFTVTATVNGGTASATEGATSLGGGKYTAKPGASVKLVAVPTDDYEFSKWSDDNKDNPRTITASDAAVYTPVFVSTIWMVNVTAPSGSHFTVDSGGTQKVTKGTALNPNIVITPEKGYELPDAGDAAWNTLKAAFETDVTIKKDPDTGAITISGTPKQDISNTLLSGITAAPKPYALTVPEGNRGQAAEGSANGVTGGSVTLKPKDGFALADDTTVKNAVTVTDKNGQVVGADKYTVTNGTVTFTGTSVAGDYTVTVDDKAFTIKNSTGVEHADGSGFIKAEVAEGTKYAVTDKDGAAIPGVKAYDKNGTELTANNGWYTTENGPIKFAPIPAGSEAKLVSTTTTDTTSTPATESVQASGTIAGVPAIGNNAYGGADAENAGKTTITIDPADPALVYGLVDENGDAVEAGAWKGVEADGTVTFDNLEPNKKYQVVAKPAQDDDSATTGKTGTGVAVTTPAAAIVDLKPADVTVDWTDGDKDTVDITVNPAKAGQEYAVIDKATGEVVTGDTWTAGNNGEIKFTGLNPDKDYQVVTRTPAADSPKKAASLPTKGVAVPSTTVKPSEVDTAAQPNGKTSITVNPTDTKTKYAVVDDQGNVVGDWQTGVGNNKDLVFPNLNPGGKYTVVAVPEGTENPDVSGLVGPTIKVPVITPEQISGTVADTDGDGNGKKDASITIKPADPNLSYAIVDQDGNVVGDANGWKTPTNGSVTFSPLDPNTKYEVVAVPKDTPNKPTSSMTGNGTEITTPAEKKAEADKIDRDTNTGGDNAGKDKIVIDSTDPTLDYAIVDPATGKVVAPVLDGSGSSDEDGWQTGNSGKLTFDGLTPGKPYEVVTRPHVTDGSIPVANQPGVKVGKTGVLEASGIVKDAHGPVANATVKVTVATTDGGYVTIKATTDANGKYTLKGTNILLPSAYTIYVDSGKGVASSTQTFNKNQPQDLDDITVDKAATGNTNIVGGAVSDYGKPVENQKIVVRDKADGTVVVPSGGSVTTTTEGGGYTLEDLPDGTYIVEATTSDGKSGMTEIKVSGGKITANEAGGYTNTNIPVTPGGIVSGTVSGLKAGEKAPVTINVPLYNEKGEVIGTKTVTGVAEGPGGYWQIAGVPEGDYPVTVTTPNGVVTGTATVGDKGAVSKIDGSEPANAMTTTGGKLNVTVPTAKPGKPNAITGVVVNKDNKPVENAKVIIYNEQGDKVGEATTGKGGGYTVPNDLPNGNYYISADQGGKNGLTGPVQITNGQTSGKTTVTVSEDASKLLEGTVTKEGGATKAANATVVVKDSSGNVIATTKTNANGQYFVGSVPAGAEVSIVTPDGETAKFTVSTTTSEGAYNGDATTAKPASGSKPVIGPSGEKLPITIGTGGTTTAKLTITGPNPAADNVNGEFTVTDGNLTAKTDGDKPVPGTYTVTVEQNGMKVEKTITVNSEGKISDNNPIVIAPHTVTGTVKYGTGVVPSDASISVPGWGEARVNTTTGKYTLTGIPDGEYKATIKVTDSNKAAPNNVSEIEVTLKVENGVASYETPKADTTTGASVTPSGTDLTVTPTSAVNDIAGKVNTAKSAVDAAKSGSGTVADAINAVKAAQDAINGATEEELKQLDKNAAQALANALAELLTGDLKVEANATGMTNAGEATTALNSQKGLLVEHTELKAATEAQKTVEVSLALKAEDVTNEPTSAVNKDIPKVEAVASATGAEKTALYEIVVEKTTIVKQEGNPISETTSNVTTLPAPITLTLNIPQNLRGYQYYGVVRVHNGNAERIPSTATANTITITSNLYSTYAILASNDPIFPDDLKVDNGGTPVNPGGNGGGGGSSSSTTVKVEKTEGGKVTVDKPSASKGDKVTITCKPDSGYEVGSVTVTDKNGNTIKVTDIGNNKYTFTMPATKPVTVEVEYVRSAGAGTDYGNCPKDRTCPIDKFTDASPTAWYHDGVHFCVDEGLMAGTSSTTFSPNTSTTRGMIVTILYRLEGAPSAGTSSFPDVAAGQYYADAVAWANAHGIVTGYTNGNFGPNDPITREQMAAILYRYASYKGYDVSERADLGKFSDRNSVSGYAVEPLSWANAEGLITGMGDGALNPGGYATRAQVATILMRFCEMLAD